MTTAMQLHSHEKYPATLRAAGYEVLALEKGAAVDWRYLNALPRDKKFALSVDPECEGQGPNTWPYFPWDGWPWADNIFNWSQHVSIVVTWSETSPELVIPSANRVALVLADTLYAAEWARAATLRGKHVDLHSDENEIGRVREILNSDRAREGKIRFLINEATATRSCDGAVRTRFGCPTTALTAFLDRP